jgi:pimeloyl-ACP methyl ester carboxylesterase
MRRTPLQRIGTNLSLAVLLCGLVSLVGCSAMTPGPLEAVEPVSQRDRIGNAYLLRGWIGIFSTGIDNLGKEIDAQGVNAIVYQQDQWRQLADVIRDKYKNSSAREPLILIGHSYGADGVLGIAERLNADHINVDLVVTLDAVTPPKVPANVRRCVNLYQSNGAMDALPWLRGIPLERAEGNAATTLVNSDLRKDRTDLLEPGLNHFNIEKKAKVHGEVVKEVLALCPPRSNWARTNTPGVYRPSAVTALPPPKPATPATPVPSTRPTLASAHATP